MVTALPVAAGEPEGAGAPDAAGAPVGAATGDAGGDDFTTGADGEFAPAGGVLWLHPVVQPSSPTTRIPATTAVQRLNLLMRML